MSWLDTLSKVGKIAGVVVPLVAPQFSASAGIANLAVALISMATKDGVISSDEVAQINALLVPHGFALVHLESK